MNGTFYDPQRFSNGSGNSEDIFSLGSGKENFFNPQRFVDATNTIVVKTNASGTTATGLSSISNVVDFGRGSDVASSTVAVYANLAAMTDPTIAASDVGRGVFYANLGTETIVYPVGSGTTTLATDPGVKLYKNGSEVYVVVSSKDLQITGTAGSSNTNYFTGFGIFASDTLLGQDSGGWDVNINMSDTAWGGDFNTNTYVAATYKSAYDYMGQAVEMGSDVAAYMSATFTAFSDVKTVYLDLREITLGSTTKTSLAYYSSGWQTESITTDSTAFGHYHYNVSGSDTGIQYTNAKVTDGVNSDGYVLTYDGSSSGSSITSISGLASGAKVESATNLTVSGGSAASDVLIVNGAGYVLGTTSEITVVAGSATDTYTSGLCGGVVSLTSNTSSTSSNTWVAFSTATDSKVSVSAGDGILVTAANGSLSKIGGLNKGDAFTYGSDTYTMKADNILLRVNTDSKTARIYTGSLASSEADITASSWTSAPVLTSDGTLSLTSTLASGWVLTSDTASDVASFTYSNGSYTLSSNTKIADLKTISLGAVDTKLNTTAINQSEVVVTASGTNTYVINSATFTAASSALEINAGSTTATTRLNEGTVTISKGGANLQVSSATGVVSASVASGSSADGKINVNVTGGAVTSVSGFDVGESFTISDTGVYKTYSRGSLGVSVTDNTASTTQLYTAATTTSVVLSELDTDTPSQLALATNGAIEIDSNTAKGTVFVDNTSNPTKRYANYSSSSLAADTNASDTKSITLNGVGVSMGSAFSGKTITSQDSDSTSTFVVNATGDFYVSDTSISGASAISLSAGSATAVIATSSSLTAGDVTYTNLGDGEADVTFVAGSVNNPTIGAKSTLNAAIAAGKTATVGGVYYKENSGSAAANVTFAGSTLSSLGVGAVAVSNFNSSGVTVSDVHYQGSDTASTMIFTTTADGTTGSVKSGVVTTTFNSVDDKAVIGNVTYTGLEGSSTTIHFTNKDTDGATLTNANIQLAKDSAYNRYVSTNATINAAVGSATVANVGSSAIIGISGSADETVSIAKAISNVTTAGTAFTLNEKSLNIYGDSNGYTAVAKSDGTLGEISGISKNAVIADAKEATLNTDNQGTFTFGTSSDSVAYTISGDDSVTFLTDESSKVSNIANFAGTLKSSASSNTINGSAYSITSTLAGGVSTVAVVTNGTEIISVTGLSNNDAISGDVDSAAISMKGATDTSTLTINGTTFKVAGDKDGVVITGKEITGLASGATLTANAAGTYTINGESIQISGDEDIIVGNADGSANKKEVGDVEVTSTTSVEEIAEQAVGDTSNRSTLSAAATAELLESDNKDGDYTVNITSSTSTSDSTVDFSESTGKKTVNLTSAADVAFNDEGGNIANIGESVSKATNVSLGNGGDLAVVENSAEVNITAGAGNDTIITKNSKSSVTVDLSAGGATKVMPSAGTIVLENYDDSKGAGIQTTSNNIAKAVEGGNINGANGSITVGSGVVEISSNSEEESTSTMVNIYNLKGKMQKVGFTNNDGGSVGSSETKQAMVLKGNYSSDKSGGSTMQGGKGNDTIFAGATDEVNAGGGSNVIGLTSNRSGSSDGATINMNAEDNGRTTITGGFDRNSDKLNLLGDNIIYRLVSGVLKIVSGRSNLTINGMSSSSSSSDIARSYDIGETEYTDFIQGSGDDTVRVAVGAENGVIEVASNEDEIATSYHGTKSGIDLTNFEGDAVINLATSSATLGGADDVSIDGVTKLMAGNGDAILAGSEANETIAAGSGNVTIWGGKGKDLLVGNTDTENKNGAATFYYQTGDGRDTIQNFTFLSEDTDGLADSIMSTANISEVKATNGNVVIQFSATDNLIVEGGVGKNISFSDGKVMQVNDELTFDGYANYFVGTSNKATLSVEGENVSNANIWLDNTQSGYYSSNIKVLDASNYEGQSTLVGNANNNTITASKDGALMWGGSSSGNNTLICGAGDDTIYYAGNANDEVTGAGESDLIFLGGNLNGVSINIEGTDIAFKYNTGNSVTIENAVTSGVGVQVNGVTYMYNGEGWEQK